MTFLSGLSLFWSVLPLQQRELSCVLQNSTAECAKRHLFEPVLEIKAFGRGKGVNTVFDQMLAPFPTSGLGPFGALLRKNKRARQI